MARSHAVCDSTKRPKARSVLCAFAPSLPLAVRVLAIDLEQVIAVRPRRRRGPAHAFALGFRDGVPAFLRDGPGELLVDVQRHHRDAVDAGELEQRQVELGRQLPDRVPLRLLEQLLDGELAATQLVQHRLRAAREHLEADHHVGPLRVQRRQHLQLPAVIVVLVVLFAEQHDILFRHRRQHGGSAGDARLPAVQHRPGGGMEAGLPGRRGLGIAGLSVGVAADADRAAGEGHREYPIERCVHDVEGYHDLRTPDSAAPDSSTYE